MPAKTKPTHRSPPTAILVTSEGTNLHARSLRHAVASCLRDGMGTKHTGNLIRIPADMAADDAISGGMFCEKKVKEWMKVNRTSQVVVYGTDVDELRSYCRRIHVRPTLHVHISKEPRK